MFNICLHVLTWRYVYDENDSIIGRTCALCKETELF